MMIHAGFQSFEFQQAFEMPKPLNFATEQDALKWLKHLWSQHPDLISRFREYLSRYSGDQEGSRLTDNQTVERLAVLLYARRIVVIAREARSGSGQPRGGAEPLPPHFLYPNASGARPRRGRPELWRRRLRRRRVGSPSNSKTPPESPWPGKNIKSYSRMARLLKVCSIVWGWP